MILDKSKRYTKPSWGNMYIKRDTNIYGKGFWRYFKCINGTFKAEGPVSAIVLESIDLLEVVNVYIKTGKIETKGIKMETDVNYVGGDYKLVEVTFELGKDIINLDGRHIYKMDIDKKVKINGLVVVESSAGYGLAKVINCIDNIIDNAAIAKQAIAWVVDVVSTKRHMAKIKATERREYILTQLEEKKKALESINLYNLLAESDPIAAKLVAELKQLGV